MTTTMTELPWLVWTSSEPGKFCCTPTTTNPATGSLEPVGEPVTITATTPNPQQFTAVEQHLSPTAPVWWHRSALDNLKALIFASTPR